MDYYPGTKIPKFLSVVQALTYERVDEIGGVKAYRYNLPRVEFAEPYYNTYLRALEAQGFELQSAPMATDGKQVALYWIYPKRKSAPRVGGVGLYNFSYSADEINRGGTGVITVFVE